mmetsp:Transcript_18945/g.43550  ORF Transcript_18945/g.43550 Transcript_18945/m.43550 type:complete len:348 (-) Transcript_18945:2228-3271(-)
MATRVTARPLPQPCRKPLPRRALRWTCRRRELQLAPTRTSVRLFLRVPAACNWRFTRAAQVVCRNASLTRADASGSAMPGRACADRDSPSEGAPPLVLRDGAPRLVYRDGRSFLAILPRGLRYTQPRGADYNGSLGRGTQQPDAQHSGTACGACPPTRLNVLCRSEATLVGHPPAPGCPAPRPLHRGRGRPTVLVAKLHVPAACRRVYAVATPTRCAAPACVATMRMALPRSARCPATRAAGAHGVAATNPRRVAPSAGVPVRRRVHARCCDRSNGSAAAARRVARAERAVRAAHNHPGAAYAQGHRRPLARKSSALAQYAAANARRPRGAAAAAPIQRSPRLRQRG